MWISYKYCFTYKEEVNWKYIEIDDDLVKEYIEDDSTGEGLTEHEAIGEVLENEYDIPNDYHYQNDGFKYIKYGKVKHPPINIILELVKKHKKDIEYSLKKLKNLNELYETVLNENGFLTKKDVEL